MATYQDTDQFLSGIEVEPTEPEFPVMLLPTFSRELEPAVSSPAPWHPRLTFDIALGDDAAEALQDRYNLTQEQLDAYYIIPAFRREVADHQKTIREEGITFRQKAKVQAEMYLENLDRIVNDVEVSAATRLDAIKSVVKWADLEPKVDKAAQGNVPQFNIQINL